MALQPQTIGVPFVFLSTDNSVAVPNLTTLVFDCSAVTPTDLLVSDIRSPLALTTNYQVMITLMGRDGVNKGYTQGQASPGSGILQVTAGQGIKVHVANANWPVGFDSAVCAVLYLKKGSSANWAQADFAFIDVNNDFNFLISSDAAPSAPVFAQSLLQSVTTDASLGSRLPLGIAYAQLGPTTGGVTINRDVTTVTVPPDNAPDYQVSTARAAGLQFQTLPNGIKDVIRAIGGNYSQFTGDLASTITLGNLTSITAQALFRGNRSIKLTMPVDASGQSEIKVFLGNLTTTQAAVPESRTKTAVAPIQYNLSTAPQDSLLNGMASEISYKRN